MLPKEGGPPVRTQQHSGDITILTLHFYFFILPKLISVWNVEGLVILFLLLDGCGKILAPCSHDNLIHLKPLNLSK